MDPDNLDQVLDVLNCWWNQGTFPPELLYARVVLIFKKGTPSDLANYRPISLLNSIYKLYAALLQARISKVIDPYLTSTQYGFRKHRSTADALLSIRRLNEIGAAGVSAQPNFLLLLDWEKAFDKVSRPGLHSAMERLGLPPKYLSIIQALYNQPQFKVEMDQHASNWHVQETGIRQGCHSLHTFSSWFCLWFSTT
jgi:hypothetical protein